MSGPARFLAAAVGVLTVLAAALLWLQAERTQAQLRQQILAQSEQRSLQLADAMAGQVSYFLGNIDLALLQLRRVWVGDRRNFDEAGKTILASFPAGAASHLSVTGADGYVTYDSLGGTERPYVGDRLHFVALKSGADRIVIGRPVRSRITGQWAFIVGRPILRNGTFDGTLQILVSTEYMAAQLARLELSVKDVVALMHGADGAFIARSRDNDKAMGTGVPSHRPFLAPGAPNSGVFRVEGLLDGTSRMYGWQRVRDYGLIVAIGLEDETVLAPLASSLAQTRRLTVVLIALVAVFGGGVAVLLLRLARNQDRLAANEARFRGLAELSSDWYWEQDAELRFIDPAEAGIAPRRKAQRYAGLKRWELNDVSLTPEQWAAHRAVLDRREAFHGFEYQRPNADGELRWVSVSGMPLFDRHGRFTGYRGVGKDITDWKRAQQQLADSEATLRLVVDNVPVMMAYYDRELKCRFSNREYAAFRGCNPVDVVGKPMAEVISAESWQEFQIRLPRLLAGETMRYRARRAGADGRSVVLDVALLPHRSATATVEGIFVMLHDITEQADIEERLRDSEDRFRRLSELSSDWYWEQDEQLRFRDVGEAGRRSSLMHPTPVGKARWELENTNLTPAQWAEHRAILERHEPFADFEFMRSDDQGRERWLSVSGEPVFDAQGAFAGYRGVGKDITERKRAEQALRESEARFRSVFEQAAVGMTLRSLDGGWIAINKVFEDMLGYGIDDLRAGVSPNHPDDEAEAGVRLRALFDGSVESYQYEKRYLSRDGRVIWVDFWASVVRNEDGKPFMRLAVAQDITARKCAEEELRLLNVELEERVSSRTAELAATNRELETFAYTVSHDLKAPLRGIDGYSQLLLEGYSGCLDEEGRRFLQNVRQGARNMNELIEDLLEYSRIERGGRAAERLDLAPLAEHLVGERRADPAASNCIIECAVPPLQARADREGLVVALRNLLDNAVKFTARTPGARIEVGGQRKGAYCILWVRDNGPGFDMKYHDRIFGIFERLHRAEDYPGTGVGLAIVQKAMARMGGRAWGESAPGRGTTFYLEIPGEAGP